VGRQFGDFGDYFGVIGDHVGEFGTLWILLAGMVTLFQGGHPKMSWCGPPVDHNRRNGHLGSRKL
ncbi:hypothetical protein TNCV_2111121, partial [Trichonephila clavipes]